MIGVDKFIDITIEGQTFDVALKQGGDAFPNVKKKPAYTQASIGLLMQNISEICLPTDCRILQPPRKPRSCYGPSC